MLNLLNSGNLSPQLERILKISSDSLSYILGLQSKFTIIDQGQYGSTTFKYTKSLSSASTSKEIQTNTNLQLNQKSTIKPYKPLTSNLFWFQNNANYEGTFFSDAENELHVDNWLPLSINQKLRRKDQEHLRNYQKVNKTVNTLNENQEQRKN